MLTMEKLDLKKAYPEYYTAGQKPKVVNLEPYYYIMSQGQSTPEAPDFEQAIGHLYTLAYKLKFSSKAGDMDFVVPKLEGFWWVEGDKPFELTPRTEWHWKLMMRMPDFIGKSDFDEAITALVADEKLPADHKLVFEELHEGLCLQVMHLGSYEEEGPSIEKIQRFAAQEGFEVTGKHHEIYLSDPTKTEVSKLKTIIRYSIQ